MKKILSIILVSPFLFSCSGNRKLPNNWWQGLDRTGLIQHMGFPAKEETDQHGSIIMFCQTRSGLKTISPPTSYYYYLKTFFFLDSSGHAYAMSRQKDLIPPDQTDLSIYIR